MLKDDSVFKAGSGLHGGIGFMHDTCGSLIGAGMVLSYKWGLGRDEVDNDPNREKPHVPVGKMYKFFEKEFGTVNCREISTKHCGGVFYDTSVPWQKELAVEAGMYVNCDELIRKSAARAAEILWDAFEKEKET